MKQEQLLNRKEATEQPEEQFIDRRKIHINDYNNDHLYEDISGTEESLSDYQAVKTTDLQLFKLSGTSI